MPPTHGSPRPAGVRRSCLASLDAPGSVVTSRAAEALVREAIRAASYLEGGDEVGLLPLPARRDAPCPKRLRRCGGRVPGRPRRAARPRALERRAGPRAGSARRPGRGDPAAGGGDGAAARPGPRRRARRPLRARGPQTTRRPTSGPSSSGSAMSARPTAGSTTASSSCSWPITIAIPGAPSRSRRRSSSCGPTSTPTTPSPGRSSRPGGWPRPMPRRPRPFGSGRPTAASTYHAGLIAEALGRTEDARALLSFAADHSGGLPPLQASLLADAVERVAP